MRYGGGRSIASEGQLRANKRSTATPIGKARKPPATTSELLRGMAEKGQTRPTASAATSGRCASASGRLMAPVAETSMADNRVL
jgi:hypothetical protein